MLAAQTYQPRRDRPRHGQKHLAYSYSSKSFAHLYPRGRSHEVSPVALARQASEERQRAREFARTLPQPPRKKSLSHSRPPPVRVLNVEKQEGPSRLPSIPRPRPKSRSRTRVPQPAPHLPSPPPPASLSTSASCSSISPPTASSSAGPLTPPSPPHSLPGPHDPLPPRPRTLQDEIQDAYALSNPQLARVLYLKLQGIVPTSDSDPRIWDVSEDDICAVFAPPDDLFAFVGGKDYRQAREERESAEKAQRLRKQREERRRKALERAEEVWTSTRARVREERVRVLQERARLEEEQKERALRAKELERIKKEREERERRGGYGYGAYGSRFSYRPKAASVTPPTPQRIRTEEPFTYAFPMSASPPSVRAAQLKGGSRARREIASFPSPSGVHPASVPVSTSNGRTIAFEDVLGRMRGKLFPIDLDETGAGVKRSHRVLLGLCTDTESQESDRPKQKTKRRVSGAGCKACEEACLPYPYPQPSPSPSPSAYLSATQRTTSWLSVLSLPFTAAAPTSPPAVPDIPPPPDPLAPKPRHSCGRVTGNGRAHCFIAVEVEESPLGVGSTDAPSPPPTPTVEPQAPLAVPDVSETKHDMLPGPLAAVARLARTMQHAYVSVMAPDVSEPRKPDEVCVRELERAVRGWRPPFEPEDGGRVRREDVRAFLAHDGALPSSARDEQGAYPFLLLPLRDMTAASMPPSTPSPSRTSPSPSPPPVHFPSMSPTLPRFPYAASFPVGPDSATECYARARAVGNPTHLRLLALAHVCRDRAVRWEGVPGSAGALGAGRERVFSVSAPGRGSALRWGWRVVWDEAEVQ
ncbi:hypothetical protein DENSPDRAFT_113837 [Dentipellis sp. KUC8613]|nr:hypothetical protein DENSPDRAFT_113837 [Dentipellis sp. KUC8613]